MLRGSRKDEYQLFINEVVTSRNSNPKRVERFEEELALLKPLPSKKYYAPLIKSDYFLMKDAKNDR